MNSMLINTDFTIIQIVCTFLGHFVYTECVPLGLPSCWGGADSGPDSLAGPSSRADWAKAGGKQVSGSPAVAAAYTATL